MEKQSGLAPWQAQYRDSVHFFEGWVSGIPMVRLFFATVRSAAESLARFGPPGSGQGTPSPGLAPGRAADRSGGQVPCRSRAGAVLPSVLRLASDYFSDRSVTVLISAMLQPNFRCIIICISLHILSESAYKMHGK